MKKTLALILSAMLMFSLAACGGEPAADSSADGTSASADGSSDGSTVANNSSASSNSSSEPEQEPAYELNRANCFSNGFAFIRFRDTTSGKYYCGTIDAKGKLQGYFEGSSINDSTNTIGTNTSGYIYTQNYDNATVSVVGPDGKVSTHSLGADKRLYATLGDGYVIIEEHQAGFDSEDWVYHLYDGSGKELTTFSYGCTVNVQYKGEGIFVFKPNSDKEFTAEQITARNDYGRGVQYVDLYCAKSNVWQKDQLVMTSSAAFEGNLQCQDGILMLRGASHQQNSRNPNPGEYTYVDSEGVLKSITVPQENGKEPFYLGHRDGVMLFTDRSNSQAVPVYRYDVASGKWSSYQGNYADKMHTSTSYPSVTGEGYTAISLKGADSRVYTMLLDKDLKEVWDEPILGIPSAITGGTVYLFDPDNTSTLCSYDLKGKLLGEIKNVNRDAFQPEDGVIPQQEPHGRARPWGPLFLLCQAVKKQITISFDIPRASFLPPT